MVLSERQKRLILEFVDRTPAANHEVWLAGSRAKGTARPDSDWDVITFTPDAPREPERLFCSNLVEVVEGMKIELIFAHPDHKKTHPSCYMEDWRRFGIRLR